MEIFKKVLKEIGIAILLILAVAAVAAILFYNKIPFSKQVPESINYTNIDKNEYNVRGDVEDIANDTKTFASKASELRYYELIKLVLPGRHRPFGSINGVTDLPSEYVGQGVTSAGSGNGSNNAGFDLELYGEENDESVDAVSLMEKELKNQNYGGIDTERLSAND